MGKGYVGGRKLERLSPSFFVSLGGKIFDVCLGVLIHPLSVD